VGLAFKAVEELGIAKVVVASTTGDSRFNVAERLVVSGAKVVVVGHQFGCSVPGKNRFRPKNLKRLRKLGA
jgi:hypothetical protein